MSKKNINKAIVKAKIQTLLDNGYEKIHTKEELLEYPKGSLVNYITKTGLFKKGGFIKSIEDEYVDLDNINLMDKDSISVQFKKIRTMYVGNPLKLMNRTKTETNFPVKIGNEIIYYAKDNFDKRRFKNTDRYKLMKKWYGIYGE